MSWVRLLVNLVAIAAVLLAIATAWRVGGGVIRKTRVWTRAWFIFVSVIAIGVSGWLLPFGAVYVLARYGSTWRRRRSTVA